MMPASANPLGQIQTLLRSLSAKQRLMIGGAALAAGVAVALFAWRHSGANYQPLYTSLSAEDAGAIVQKLKEKSVPYRLSENGSTILVPSSQVAETRLEVAATGLPKTGRIGFELFDKSQFGATDFMEHVNFRRALEGELERSMMALGSVEAARVHITFPKESVFSENRLPAKASVMLRLKHGAQLSQQNVTAVQYLVASAVEGLEPNHVSVLDMQGNLLGRPKEKGGLDGSEPSEATIEYEQQIEKSLVAKINATLEPLLGPERFRAAVVAECDFTSGDQSEEILDPGRSVITTEQRTKETSTVANGGGVPGTASNLPRPVPRTPLTTGTSRETESMSYETSRIVKHTRLPQGTLKRISASVLVDQTVRWEGPPSHPKRVLVPPSAEELRRISDVVSAAIGIRPERGDRLVVETLPFETTLQEEPPRAPAPAPSILDPWKSSKRMLPILLVCVAVLMFGLAFVRRLRRRTRTVAVAAQPALGASPAAPAPAVAAPNGLAQLGSKLEEELHRREQAAVDQIHSGGSALQRLTQEIAELATQDPTLCANVVRTWLAESQLKS
jgi:flagellar M-ring protein FliF